MQGKIRFSYDLENDVVIAATLNVLLKTEEDVVEWYQLWVNYLKIFRRKVDLVVDLSGGFSFVPAIGETFGKYRLKVHEEFSKSSYRVNPNSLTKQFVQTSAVRGQALQTADCYSTVEAAINALTQQRRQQAEEEAKRPKPKNAFSAAAANPQKAASSKDAPK